MAGSELNDKLMSGVGPRGPTARRIALYEAPPEFELCKEILHHRLYFFVGTQSHRSARPLPTCPCIARLKAEDNAARGRGSLIQPPASSAAQEDQADYEGRRDERCSVSETIHWRFEDLITRPHEERVGKASRPYSDRGCVSWPHEYCR